MTRVVHSHFACRLRPVDVHLLLRLAGESGHWHDPIVCSLGACVLLGLQSSSSHLKAAA